MGFEWDLEGTGIYEAARYGFEWDFEGGHFMRSGFEWDLEGGDIFMRRATYLDLIGISMGGIL